MSRAELEEERQFLLESLRDLERERDAGEIAESDYQALREDYTARAAEVLRALDQAPDEAAVFASPAEQQAPTSTRRGRGQRRRRAVAAFLVAGMIAVAGAGVFLLSAGREEGQPLTGSVPQTVAGKLARAHQLEGEGEALEALKLYDAVLREDPANVEAMTYRGWLLKLAGLVDPAQAALDKAVATDPSYPDAHFFRGMLLYQDRKDPAAAVPEFEAYLASNPPEGTRQAVQDVLDRARADAAPGG